MRSHRQQQLHMPTGPCETIGNSSYLFRWAHSKPLTEAAVFANGLIRSLRQQQQHMPMGPREAIDRSSRICQWAYAIPSATAAAYFDGLIEKSDCCCGWLLAGPSTEAAVYTNGPIRSLRQQQPHIPMGPRETIGQQELLTSMGPCGAINSNSCIWQWAHAKPSAATATYANRPMRRGMRYHRQQ